MGSSHRYWPMNELNLVRGGGLGAGGVTEEEDEAAPDFPATEEAGLFTGADPSAELFLTPVFPARGVAEEEEDEAEEEEADGGQFDAFTKASS
jgi:hypothetical protein